MAKNKLQAKTPKRAVHDPARDLQQRKERNHWYQV